MKRFILVAVVVLGLAEMAPAHAQFFVGPAYPRGYGSYYSYRSGYGFAVPGAHLRVSGFYGGFAARPFLPPFGVSPYAPVGFGFGNPFLGSWGPGFGYGAVGPYGYGPAVVAVTVPVPVAVPVVVGGNFPDPNMLPIPGGNVPPRDDRALLPKGDFVVIAPNLPRREANPELPRVAPVPKPGMPKIGPDPFKPPGKVMAEVPEADPKREAARLVRLAGESFVAGDYGRAAENLNRAITADPAEPTTYFLYAQAKFAAGQYAEAVARIREGLARDPKWPEAAFDPIELYGDRPERFVLHLFALKKTMSENPNEATLEFLLGYQLWFAGDKVEADKLFRAAERRLPAPGPIALFK